VLRVVAFGKSELLEPLGTAADWDLVAEPNINAYRGRESRSSSGFAQTLRKKKLRFLMLFSNETCIMEAVLVRRWPHGRPRFSLDRKRILATPPCAGITAFDTDA
jgi:hypothetical protein